MRIVVELKRDANAQVVLNRLFAQTQLQTTFAINMLALVKDQSQPKILSLREILDEYLSFQEEIILRRTRYDLRKAQERAHLLEGLIIAQENIDEVIRIIRTSYDNAKENLMSRFGLSEVQAQAILDMQLKRLQGLERDKLLAEYKEIQEKIAYYQRILEDIHLVKSILKEELTAIRDKFGDSRKTEIQDVEEEIDVEDLIEEEDCCYTLSSQGYIKRMPVDTYRSQRRGGRGINGQNLKEEDYVKSIFVASTHDYAVLHGYRTGSQEEGIPHSRSLPYSPRYGHCKCTSSGAGRKGDGHAPDPGEFSENEYLMMVTKNGTVKRLALQAVNTNRKAGIRALTLDEGDHLISVMKTSGNDRIILATAQGMAICFSETDVRSMGRDAAGVKGITLAPGDYVVGAEKAEEDKSLLTVTANGYGKRTDIVEYLRLSEDGTRYPQNRGGKGLKNYNITAKTGPVVACRVVGDGEDVILIESGGVIIRMPASDINVYKRDTQGVILMRVEGDSQVIGVEKVDNQEETP